MKRLQLLIAAATLALTGAAAQAATLGLATTDPTASGELNLFVYGDTLEASGSVANSTDPTLVLEDVFFLIDSIGGDLELGIETAQVLDTGFFDQTVEFLLSGDLSAFPGGALLTITSDSFAGIAGFADLTLFLESSYPNGFDNEVGQFTLAAISAVPLPGALTGLMTALAATAVFTRRRKSVI